MDTLHWIFLILWLVTGFTLTPFAIAFLILIMKIKGGPPGTRGVKVFLINDMGIKEFWAVWDGGRWKKHTTGARDEFIITERTGVIFPGRRIDHKIREDDCYIYEDKTNTYVIAGLSHLNLQAHKMYQEEHLKAIFLESQLSDLKIQLHEAQTQINSRASEKANEMINMVGRVIPLPKRTTSSTYSQN